MKKIFSAILLIATFMISSVAMAAYQETIPDDSEIASVKRLAIGFPRHYKVEETEPTSEELAELMAFSSKVARCYVISYDDIAANIKKDTGVEIKELNELDAAKVFESNVDKYADAYVVLTTATNSKKVQYFFDVYRNGNAVYSYTVQSGDFSRDLKGYRKACEDFYKRFDSAAENKIKADEKAARKKK